jgi:hypothetical protein
MRALKLLGIAVLVAVVTAASVVWYIDYKTGPRMPARSSKR